MQGTIVSAKTSIRFSSKSTTKKDEDDVQEIYASYNFSKYLSNARHCVTRDFVAEVAILQEIRRVISVSVQSIFMQDFMYIGFISIRSFFIFIDTRERIERVYGLQKCLVFFFFYFFSFSFPFFCFLSRKKFGSDERIT